MTEQQQIKKKKTADSLKKKKKVEKSWNQKNQADEYVSCEREKEKDVKKINCRCQTIKLTKKGDE